MTARLVLFDIDGTLVDVRGAGRRAFCRAIEAIWGIQDDLHDVNFGGATDLGVLAQLRARLPLAEGAHSVFFTHMARLLEEELAAQPPLALPGASGAVDALVARQDVVLGLLTGNARACARIKILRTSSRCRA